ncbi:hypothetical protein ATANTOWER_003473 [Ataeniobius toweri]|uniref:Uncharacterized protein n=1 Tax=Ataeniobius toweri TaxID=208326 RepID=A0ABU7CE94_9TELE|nr:hypothetical protein [Ataeniobius toweri]
MSLNHGLCELSVSWLNFVSWISFSTSFSSGSSTKLAVSSKLHLLDQELSVTCPPSTASISTRKQPHLSPSTIESQPSDQLSRLDFNNPNPESLYPWRPDHIHSNNNDNLTNS